VKVRHPLLVGTVLALAGATPAAAADVRIGADDTVLSAPVWTPAQVNVEVGSSVTWDWTGAPQAHPVLSNSPNWSFSTPNGATTATKLFDAPGAYEFLCGIHDNMRGVVLVGGAAPPPPPPPGQQPFPNDSPEPNPLETGGLDTTKPALQSVRVRRDGRGARVSFRVSERARVTVRLKRGSKVVRSRSVTVAGNGRLSVRGKGLRAGRYRVEISARDIAGNASGTRTARVTLR